MDDSGEFDLDQMMEQIRQKIHESRRTTESAACDEASGNPSLQADLEKLHRLYNLNEVSLDPGLKVLGWTFLTAARAISRLLRPIIRQQSGYNAANTRVTSELKERVDGIHPQFEEIRSIAEGTLAAGAEEFKVQAQALMRRLDMRHGQDIEMHRRALLELSRKVEAMEQRQQFLVEQAGRAEVLERRGVEMRQQLERVNKDIQALGQQYEELATTVAAVRVLQSETEARIRSRSGEFKSTRDRLSRAERRLRRLLLAEAEKGANGADIHDENPTSAPPALGEFDYAAFEDRVRDSRMVKDKQGIYVEYFAGKAPVIDAGCGKGEFLELMRETGTEAKGLDLDLDMVLECKEKGLDAHRCDALQYLMEQPDGSIGGIFSAQVIEHMTSAQLDTLITLAWRKLRPGGILLLETLNPESLFVHYKWFWMDPSHIRLVHPETLQFLFDSTGFVDVKCHFCSPPTGVIPIPPLTFSANGSLDEFNRATDYLNKLFYGDQEYFVVARK
jgi:O-antigen chain-terminating methyltransferase